MIRRVSAFLLAAIVVVSAVSVISQAQSQPLMTRHVRDAVVNGEAKSVGRLPTSQTMHFDVVLALRHAPELDNFLQELYDPTSPSYRHFVTAQEFTERFGPSQEDYDALIRFAKANGLEVLGGSRDAMDVQFKGTVAAIEKAFHVTMGVYQHPTDNRTFYAPDREPTPDLPFQLWHISGLDNYSIPRPLVQHKNLLVKPEILGSCPGNSYCGSDMRAAYYGSGPLTGAGQNLGLLEYYGYDLADLSAYFNNVGQTNNVPVKGISTDGSSLNCVYPGCDDSEQILDMTQAISMAPGLKALYVYVGSTDTAILSSMSTRSPLPAQLSSSWTWTPGDPQTDDPYFKKFAAQGQNYFQASNDGGAYSSSFPYVFPADDDYVTSVGGTDLLTQSAGGPWASETAWVYSGGGYYPADNIPIPAWQQLTGVITGQNGGSTTLRNSPDVSAEANFDFYVCSDQNGCSTGWGGTSFAAPMWAGYMALVNQQALANGQPTLGFINPIIYPLGLGSGYASAFHDITSGNNDCCGQTLYWTAVAGYDLVTGWGSPNGSGLINALAGSGGSPGISLTPVSLTWGKIPVGTTSRPKKVTVTNIGGAALDIADIVTNGDFALVPVKQTRKVTPCVSGSLVAVGASCVVKVTFTPTQTGSRTGNLTFTDNAPGSPQNVPLSGTGK